MKKSMKFLALFLGFVVLSMFSGCKLVEQLTGPKNKWYRYDYEYENGGQKYKLFCYIIYSNGNYTSDVMIDLSSTDSADENNKLVKGLTIVMAPQIKNGNDESGFSDLFLNGRVGKSYVIKTFKEGESIALNEDGESGGQDHHFIMGDLAWGIIYNSIELKSAQLPAALNTDPGDYTPITNLQNFSWKKLLAGMALSYLMNSGALDD